MNFRQRLMERLINFYPPILGAGIRSRTADIQGKIEPTFVVDVTDDEGQVVAHVEKLLYVRRKKDA